MILKVWQIGQFILIQIFIPCPTDVKLEPEVTSIFIHDNGIYPYKCRFNRADTPLQPPSPESNLPADYLRASSLKCDLENTAIFLIYVVRLIFRPCSVIYQWLYVPLMALVRPSMPTLLKLCGCQQSFLNAK